MPIGLWSYQKSEHQIRHALQHSPHGQSGSSKRSLAEKELLKERHFSRTKLARIRNPAIKHTREAMQKSEGYLLNNFLFAVASSLSLASPISGYSKSRSARVSITAAPTTTRVNHLLSAGTTYHGASF